MTFFPFKKKKNGVVVVVITLFHVYFIPVDGHSVMAAGSPVGHIGLWDLEAKKLIGQMRDAHTTSIAGLTFLHGEPLLLTNGADNAIRVCLHHFFLSVSCSFLMTKTILFTIPSSIPYN